LRKTCLFRYRKPTDDQRKNIEGVRKKQIMYKGKSIKITADFSTETLKARRVWSEVCQTLNENNFSPRTLYLTVIQN
jgi:hypothetical protein